MANPVYSHALEVSVEIPAVNLAGETITATSAAYRILDAERNELVSLTNVVSFVSGDQKASVTVEGSVNTLEAGIIRDMRVVEVKFSTAEGDIINSVKYVVQADTTLIIMGNSFQTLEQAEIAAMDMPNLKVWGDKGDQERAAALVDAYYNLCKLRYSIPGTMAQNRQNWGSNIINDITDYSALEFLTLESRFVTALRKAQVAEADVILEGDLQGELRREGVISYTIGETSQFFRPTKPLDLAVSVAALKYLRGFVSWAIPIARA